MTIPHAVEAKYASARIMLFPARGRGVVAGSSARAIIELAGIRDEFKGRYIKKEDAQKWIAENGPSRRRRPRRARRTMTTRKTK